MTYFSYFGTPSISSELVELEIHDLLFIFWDPLDIFGIGGARNFKFGMHIDHERR